MGVSVQERSLQKVLCPPHRQVWIQTLTKDKGKGILEGAISGDGEGRPPGSSKVAEDSVWAVTAQFTLGAGLHQGHSGNGDGG